MTTRTPMAKLGVYLFATVPLLTLACGAQVDDGYRGEPMLTLQGEVILAEGSPSDLVPALVMYGPRGYQTVIDGELHGEFPSRFRMDIIDAPPSSTYFPDAPVEGNLSLGYITVVPREHPTVVPFLTIDEKTACADEPDETSCAVTKQLCIPGGGCLQRSLECTRTSCPVIAEFGEPVADRDLARGSVAVKRSGSVSALTMQERCHVKTGACHRVFQKCTRSDDARIWTSGTIETCRVLDEQGDPSVKEFEHYSRAALGYTVLYLTHANTIPGVGQLAAGYHLVKTIQPADEPWVAAMLCQRTSKDPAECPDWLEYELVEDHAVHLTLTLGPRDANTSP